MSQHTVKITAKTISVQFPAGTVSSGIRFTLGTFPPVLAAAPYLAQFDLVDAGVYPLTMRAIDADGNNLGEASTGMITVQQDAVNLDIPNGFDVEII